MTSLAHDIAYVNALFESMYGRYFTTLPAQEQPGEGGVPPAMQCGPVDEEGWVRWQMVPSTIGPQHIAAIERQLDAGLPQVMQAWLLAHHHLFSEFNASSHQFILPENSVEQPLQGFLELALAWKPLDRAGLLTFGEYGDGSGPCCLDLHAPGTDGDFPVVWLDHDGLHGLAPDQRARRASLEPLIKPLYPSFRAFLAALFA